MKIAGIGFRTEAPTASLEDALSQTGHAVDAIATAADKAKAPQITELAEILGVPLIAVPLDELKQEITITQSPRVAERYGTGSLAEAAALAAVGENAHLLDRRVTSTDGMATAAIAEGPDA